MWTSFVDVIRASIFAAAHLCGGSLGGGVLVVSFTLRLALLPLTLRLARRALHQQRRLQALKPAFDRLQKRFADDPARLLRETQALQHRHGIRLFDPRSLLGGLAQMPLLGGLFSAVRSGLGAKVGFLWIADLAKADGALILLVAAASAGAMSLAPTVTAPQSASASALPLVLAAIATIAFLWSASSAIALSWGAGSVVSALQGWLLQREERLRLSPGS